MWPNSYSHLYPYSPRIEQDESPIYRKMFLNMVMRKAEHRKHRKRR